MARFAWVLCVFALLVFVPACGGGGGKESYVYVPPTPVVVDPDAVYSVTYTMGTGGRPTVIANGAAEFDRGVSRDTFNLRAVKKNVTVSAAVFRCSGDGCGLIEDIYFMYLSSTQTGFLSVRAEAASDGALIVNFNPPLIAEIGAEDWKTWLSAGYNISSFSSALGQTTFHLEYDGTDSRNQAVETATGLAVNGNKQVIAADGHIICPQTVLSDSWSCS